MAESNIGSTGNFTAVSLIQYNPPTKGFIYIDSKKTLVGYCVESPREVLETVFQDYSVASYMGYELLDREDFESNTPMLGLTLFTPTKVYGVEYNGKLEEMLLLEELLKAKREKPVSAKDIRRITKYLGKEDKLDWFRYPDNDKRKQDKQEIIDIINNRIKTGIIKKFR